MNISWLRKCKNELLVVYTSQLLEKEHSGCQALFKFVKHVTAGGTDLVQVTEDATSNKASSSSRNNMHKGQGGVQKRAEAKWKYPPRGRLKLIIHGSSGSISMKLSNEAKEEPLEKIVKLFGNLDKMLSLACISDKDPFAARLVENAASMVCLAGGTIA